MGVGAVTIEGIKMEKVSWDVGRNVAIMRIDLGYEGKGKGIRKNMHFSGV